MCPTREQVFQRYDGACAAKIISTRLVQSDLHPGEARRAFKAQYTVDQNTQEFEEEEIRPLLVISSMPERKKIIEQLTPAFDYLEARITSACETSSYSCAAMYQVSCAVVKSTPD